MNRIANVCLLVNDNFQYLGALIQSGNSPALKQPKLTVSEGPFDITHRGFLQISSPVNLK
ncbi:hypothetical protein JOC55_001694 [Paenibacillus sacheonensis]|nr:hypothetical protein [Paenibacillus sacheonensis]